VGVQEVRFGGGGTATAGEYTLSYGKGNENQDFVHNGMISAVKRIEFVSEGTSHRVLRGRLCHIIVLYVRAPKGDKIDDIKVNFYKEIEGVVGKFPKYDMKIVLGDSNECLQTNKYTPWRLVRKRTMPTERPPLVYEIDFQLLWIEGCRVVRAADPLRSLISVF
jgi:hypothetical protein